MKIKNKSLNYQYRKFVGPIETYDIMSAIQFIRLYQIGLRETSNLLEIGAGSLRAAKLLIPFLRAGHYFGIEPNKNLVDDGFKFELGREICNIKLPKFVYNSNFDFSELGLPKTGVDFALAQSIFSHTSIGQFSKCLKNVSAILKKSGILLATYVNGEEDYKGSNWVYPECVKFRKETLLRIAFEAGLNVRVMNWVHPNDQTWILFCKNPNIISQIVQYDDISVVEYIRTIDELRRRINYAKSFLPVRIVLWLKGFLLKKNRVQ